MVDEEGSLAEEGCRKALGGAEADLAPKHWFVESEVLALGWLGRAQGLARKELGSLAPASFLSLTIFHRKVCFMHQSPRSHISSGDSPGCVFCLCRKEKKTTAQ